MSLTTKAQLDALRAARPTLDTQMHYTPDSMTVIAVHSQVERQRIGTLNQGEQLMQPIARKVTQRLGSSASCRLRACTI
tara:strand:- start:93 stop:329 length:237 start_codon:yes stop_codon:yes gene_type:complete